MHTCKVGAWPSGECMRRTPEDGRGTQMVASGAMPFGDFSSCCKPKLDNYHLFVCDTLDEPVPSNGVRLLVVLRVCLCVVRA